MFINRAKDGSNNLCGKAVSEKRKALGLSQRALADRLRLIGLDVNRNAVQRTGAGKRFVTDIELVALSKVPSLSLPDLLPKAADN